MKVFIGVALIQEKEQDSKTNFDFVIQSKGDTLPTWINTLTHTDHILSLTARFMSNVKQHKGSNFDCVNRIIHFLQYTRAQEDTMKFMKTPVTKLH